VTGRRWLAVAIALALLACGRSDEPEGSPSPSPRETVPASELVELSERWAETPATITYRQRSGVPGGEPAVTTLVLTWSPPDAWRMDVSSDAGETILIVDGRESYFCSEVEGERTCFASPARTPGGVAPVPFLAFFSDPDGLGEEIRRRAAGAPIERSSARIAGEAADCFRVEQDDAGGVVGWCFAEDGLLLRFASEGGVEGAGAFTIEATEVERRVASGAFEPPYPVSDVAPPPSG
jgi:hypothetical protein